MDINLENWNTQNIIHTSNEVQEERMQKMWYIYTMEYYSAIRNKEFMKFLGKWMELENIILSEVTQTQKVNHGMHSLISGVTSLSMMFSRSIHLPKNFMNSLFLMADSTPLCRYTTFFASTLLLRDTWVLSSFWILLIGLL